MFWKLTSGVQVLQTFGDVWEVYIPEWNITTRVKARDSLIFSAVHGVILDKVFFREPIINNNNYNMEMCHHTDCGLRKGDIVEINNLQYVCIDNHGTSVEMMEVTEGILEMLSVADGSLFIMCPFKSNTPFALNGSISQYNEFFVDDYVPRVPFAYYPSNNLLVKSNSTPLFYYQYKKYHIILREFFELRMRPHYLTCKDTLNSYDLSNKGVLLISENDNDVVSVLGKADGKYATSVQFSLSGKVLPDKLPFTKNGDTCYSICNALNTKEELPQGFAIAKFGVNN